ncbi:DNA mismatch repair protein MutS [Treponema parvum]|uniref:DNA mismatch repair protein MutS n=1 Tax=Treponema parvum TaxID=138851 RepID=A0A975F072_9SPIR|nr:DNA mismatch repair protein MutS [Treponema parvum]QTQ12094.1 DNA mismatch repair protein MutS [Treponema parvum]
MATDSQMTPLMAQYVSIKEKHKEDVLFFRLGDFYEMFFEDAMEISRLLNLTLTHRQGTPMCGIPYHAAKIYIARLLRLGKKIVICEQVGEISHGKGLTERKVVEIITPGTAVESEYLNGYTNNYLAALSVSRGKVGFAYIDVTTSDFCATSWPSSVTVDNFSKELGRCNPREILLPLSLKNNQEIQAPIAAMPGISVTYYPDWHFSFELSYKKLVSQFKTANLQPFALNENSPEIPPAGFLLDYLGKTTNTSIPHISSIRIYHDSDYVIIDDSSRRNLEIVSNLRDGSSRYTLLECVNYTVTAMGGRMMRAWLLSPLTDCKKISARQTHIDFFVKNRGLLAKIRENLSSVLDIERLAGRIAMDRAHAKDLQALKASLASWLLVRESLLQQDFAQIPSEQAQEIIDMVQNAIADDPATSLTEGGIIKDGWSEELDRWRRINGNFNEILEKYLEEEKEQTGISTLKIKYNNSIGYCLEVTRGKLGAVPEHFIMRRSLLNADRYTTTRLQELEKELTQAETRINELERDLFIEIRNKLKNFVPYLLKTSHEIAYTDVTSSLAHAAILQNWVRPEIDDSVAFFVQGGRHPVVERHLPTGEFVPNDLALFTEAQTEKETSFALITGPNMAGKSTYLRQNALIALLAQIGSFVPAQKAHMGVVDRIFCRVGASDNLARGESTFLVEMTETAHILRSTTLKSFVIMDEVGRGTSTEDGLSIAWAVAEYLLDVLKCKTLFATHYHELTRMEHPALSLLCMEVSERSGSVVFMRKIKQGASENSYGIHVARLAGVPQDVIDRANEILAHIQSVASSRPLLSSSHEIPVLEKKEEKIKSFSPGLFSDEEMILDEILSCNTDEMTPLSALQNIARWKKSLSGR